MGLPFDAYGLSMGVRSNDPSVFDELEGALPYGAEQVMNPEVDHLFSLWLGRPSRRRIKSFHNLYHGGVLVARSSDRGAIFDILRSRLTDWVAEHSRKEIFLHAGIVEWGDRAVLIPGRSGAGKTTLVRAFVEAGARYYSDDFAILDTHGRVSPFLKPLSLRHSDGSASLCTVESLGGRAGEDSIQVGAVLSTSYDPEARWRPSVMTPGEILLVLIDNTIAVRRRPKESIERLQGIAESAPGWKGKRGDVDEVVQATLEVLSNPSL